MSQSIDLKAEKRDVLGKKVGRLRRAGTLPATVYGHHVQPQSIQVEGRAFRDALRQAGTTQLINLVIDDQPARPVLVRQMSIDAKRNTIIHVEFFQANLHEKITSHVPLHFVGESPAVREGGIFLQVLDHLDVASLPQDVPAGGIEIDLGRITQINETITAGDVPLGLGVTLVTPADEVVAKVNPPVAEEVVEEYIAETEPLPRALGGTEEAPDAVPEA